MLVFDLVVNSVDALAFDWAVYLAFVLALK